MSRNKTGAFAGISAVALGIIAVLCGSFTQAQSATSAVGGWPKGEKITYPAEGRIAGDQVRVRSGPGENYYVSAVLPRDSTVVVQEERSDWLKIDPPKDSFSLIAAEYVNKSTGDQGVVTGSVVRVRAGASHSKENYAVQCKLNKGDKVRILGETNLEVSGNTMAFYKITPPPGKAFLWVAAKYVEYVQAYEGKSSDEPANITQIPDVPDIEKVLEIPETKQLPESADRTELQNLDEALRIEMRRPIAQRRLAEHLANYLALTGKTKSKAISELCEGRMNEIRRHMDIQAALEKSASIKESYEQSQKRMHEILRARSEKSGMEQKKVRELTGRLKASYVFASRGMERWRLVDPFTGRNICYLMPGVVGTEELKSKEGNIVSVSGPAVFDPRLHLDLVVTNKLRSAQNPGEEK